MPKKTGFIKKHKPVSIKTSFEEKWGDPAYKIAERENTSTTNIHMRIRNYGTPWQRKAKPTPIEAKYGKTRQEIARELHLHPITIGLRMLHDGDVYNEHLKEKTHNRDIARTGIHWEDDKKHNFDRFWLMPEHPDYIKERAKADNFDVAKQIAIAEDKLNRQKQVSRRLKKSPKK